MVDYLRALGRGNVKELAEAVMQSEAAMELELLRIEAHMSTKDKKDVEEAIAFVRKMDKGLKRKLIYDIVPVYDIWFNTEGAAE